MRFIAFIAAASASTLFTGCSEKKAEGAATAATAATTTAMPSTSAKSAGGAAKNAAQSAISPVAQRTVSDLKNEPVVADMDALDKLAQTGEELGLDSAKVRDITSKGRALITETRLMDVNGKLTIGEIDAQVRKAVKPVVKKLQELVREHRHAKLNDLKPLADSEAVGAQLANLADRALVDIERLRDGESVKAVLKDGKLQKELVKLVDVVMAELDGDKPAKKAKAEKKPKAEKKKKVEKKPKVEKAKLKRSSPKKGKRASPKKEDTSDDEALALKYHYDDAKAESIALERQRAARKETDSKKELNEHKTLELLAAEKKKAASDKKRLEVQAEIAEVKEHADLAMFYEKKKEVQAQIEALQKDYEKQNKKVQV